MLKFSQKRNSFNLLISMAFVSIPILLLIPTVSANAQDSPYWQVNTLQWMNFNDRQNKGFFMSTAGSSTASNQSGAAFRCHMGKISGWLLEQPTDVRKQLAGLLRGLSFNVNYQIEGGPEGSSHWNQSVGGAIFTVGGKEALWDIFSAATNGSTITYSYGDNEPITTALPKAAPEMVKEFLDKCELKAGFLPVSAEEN